ncbi:MAG: NYN domain-containing protein [Alphaproteobacteria bacterium]|nr:NYN domain-containing protein [Alphaproteobacteria bacterium]
MKTEPTTAKTSYPFYPDEKVALFIDGANLYGAAKALEFDIDYRLLLRWVAERSHLVRAFYYTALLEDAEYSPLRPLVDWLDYNGFTMVTKAVREVGEGATRRKTKAHFDVDLTVDALELADQIDHAVIFSGDGDFSKLVAALQRKGVRVTAVGTIQSNPPMMSDELRRQADHFIDLANLARFIRREGRELAQQDGNELRPAKIAT